MFTWLNYYLQRCSPKNKSVWVFGMQFLVEKKMGMAHDMQLFSLLFIGKFILVPISGVRD
jgi:hypothetical protein